jgi:hypothetical protein
MSKIPQGEWDAIAARYAQGESISQIARSYRCTPPAIHYILKRNGQRSEKSDSRWEGAPSEKSPPRVPEQTAAVSTLRSAQSEQRPASVLPQSSLHPRAGDRISAFTAGLDSELHARAEIAIEAFRASFNAALGDGSPNVLARLRQAASDLMRVAARTTIVLERLSAGAERMSPRLQDRAQSMPGREHAA